MHNNAILVLNVCMVEKNKIQRLTLLNHLASRTVNRLTPTAILILGTGLYLNFQFLIIANLGDNPLAMTWVFSPVLLFFIYVPLLTINFYRSSVAFLLLLFLIVLSLHAAVQGVYYGASGVGWAMASYGLWLGLFSWTQFSDLKTVVLVAVYVFIGSALIHACAILLDSHFGFSFSKVVTIGDIERAYGISSSIAIGSLQMAVGGLVAIGLFLRVRSKKTAILLLLTIWMVIAGLLAAPVRGPIIYLLLALAFLLFARFNRGVHASKLLAFLFIGIIGSGAILGYDISTGSTRSDYILDAFDLSDIGNQGRLEQYRISFELLSEDWWIPLTGLGAAELTQLPESIGKTELTTESSFLKALLELGIIGLLPMAVLLILLTKGLVRKWHQPLINDHMEFIAVFVLVLSQCMTHETFKTWIGSFYLVLSIGICVRVLVESGYFASPRRITLGSGVKRGDIL